MSFATAFVRSFLVAAACGTAGCNINKLTANATSGMLEVGSIALDRESDLELAEAAFPASLKTLETFLISSPQNPKLLALLARGYCSYAFAFLEGHLERASLTGTDEQVDALERRAKIHYLRGSAYGFRWLNRPALETAARAGDMPALDGELARLKAEQAPALFWATYGWASTVNLSKDDPELLSGLEAIEHMMARVIELDSGYNGGAPLLFQGVYTASRPVAFGGKPDVAKKWFDRAMAEHGEQNLLVPYLYARIYAPMVQDRDLFDRLVAKVLVADVEKAPDFRLNNEVARERARFWQTRADDLILPEV